ncbi:MAG: phosphate ABC transporter ATP-binding protein PstB [bacterium]
MAKIELKEFELYYGDFRVLKKISTTFARSSITAIIGPSGCGKSTLLRSINRMNDLIEGVRVAGEILLDGKNIYDPDVDLIWLRARIGMVFQRPVAFPLSIFDNVAAAPRVRGIANRTELEQIVEKSLKAVGLWSDVKNSLGQTASTLSLGDQQKLSIARAIATEPDVVLFDEPCSALDPIATHTVEDLMRSLSENYTIIIVTHNMQQAARASDYTMFMLDGNIVEYGPTRNLFTNPKDIRTENYVTGKLG